ncbi:MAG: DUF362 domain-containing protein [Candidatus Cloacimonetes bacterium]|nr:DUF362 domain-containing protein [Candidatus Cloacimonadota bacterium]
MKNLTIVVMIICVLFFLLLIGVEKPEPAEVFFTSDISPEGVLKVFEKISAEVTGKVAIKVHFGEEGNETYLKPELVKDLVLKLDATLVETNVLYVGKRRYTDSHIKLAIDHGFDFAPIDILDSEGEKVIPVNLNHYHEIKVGSHMDDYDSFIIFSHFKGHGLSGFGGAIKNTSMGLASIAGKMALHASTIPVYNPDACILCGICVDQCPGNAISLNPLVIDPDKCIGCGTCIGICPVRAFGVPWNSTSRSVFLERLVEYAKGVSDNYNTVYINVLANITTHCDCSSRSRPPFMEDICILASTDIVAIEKASHDLVDKHYKSDDTFLQVNSVSGKNQIEYASKINLGNKSYRLIDLDE